MEEPHSFRWHLFEKSIVAPAWHVLHELRQSHGGNCKLRTASVLQRHIWCKSLWECLHRCLRWKFRFVMLKLAKNLVRWTLLATCTPREPARRAGQPARNGQNTARPAGCSDARLGVPREQAHPSRVLKHHACPVARPTVSRKPPSLKTCFFFPSALELFSRKQSKDRYYHVIIFTDRNPSKGVQLQTRPGRTTVCTSWAINTPPAMRQRQGPSQRRRTTHSSQGGHARLSLNEVVPGTRLSCNGTCSGWIMSDMTRTLDSFHCVWFRFSDLNGHFGWELRSHGWNNYFCFSTHAKRRNSQIGFLLKLNSTLNACLCFVSVSQNGIPNETILALNFVIQMILEWPNIIKKSIAKIDPCIIETLVCKREHCCNCSWLKTFNHLNVQTKLPSLATSWDVQKNAFVATFGRIF